MSALLEARDFDQTRAAELAAFVSACTAGSMEVDWVITVVTTVVTNPAAVRDLWRDGQRCAVGVVIDELEAEGNAAELSIFTVAGDIEATAELLDWGAARARAQNRSRLDVPQWPNTTLAVPVLAERGFEPGHIMFKMTRAAAVQPEIRSPLAEGWRWTPAATEHLAAYHETARLAFAGIPGSFVPPLETFERVVASHEEPPMLLLSTDASTPVAGFIRITHRADGSGELSSLGRHPSYRGRGIGQHLVARGLRRLDDLGMREVGLEVAAVNSAGLALYESFGFAVSEEMTVYRLELD